MRCRTGYSGEARNGDHEADACPARLRARPRRASACEPAVQRSDYVNAIEPQVGSALRVLICLFTSLVIRALVQYLCKRSSHTRRSATARVLKRNKKPQ